MDNDTALALIEALNTHSQAMDDLTHELSTFDTYGFEDAVDNFERAVDNMPSVQQPVAPVPAAAFKHFARNQGR